MTVRKLSQKLQIVLYKHTRCPTFSLLGSARRVCINESCLEMSPAHSPVQGWHMEMDPMKVHAFPSQLFQQWCKDLIIFCRWWLNLCMSNGPIFLLFESNTVIFTGPVLDFNTVVIMHICLRQYENSVYIKTNNTLCSLSFSSLNIKESFWKRYSCISCSISSVCHMQHLHDQQPHRRNSNICTHTWLVSRVCSSSRIKSQ